MGIESLEGEIWKDIKGYEGIYQISNMGRVKSLERLIKRIWKNGKISYSRKCPRIIANSIDSSGYYQTKLCHNKVNKSVLTHRLVAKAFVPNPTNKPEVNHIDGNRNNNYYKNLEWNTSFENHLHAKINKLRPPNTRKQIADLIERSSIKVEDAVTGRIYPSIKEAAKDLNINYSTLTDNLSGRRGCKNKTTLRYL